MSRESSSLYIFDWDGTLSDSVGRIVTCLRRAAADLGMEDLGFERFSDVIGLGLPQAINKLYPAIDQPGSDAFRDCYAAHFVAEDSAPSAFFPDALEVLRELRGRGHGLALATGKSRRGLDRVLERLELERFFDATRCADETASKPDPLMLTQIMQQLGIPPQRTLMVGDTEYDMEMGRRAGTTCIGVSFGAHSAQRLATHRPERIMDSLRELL